jgi:RimJ/RimL family protein N-acetyltransferase
MNKISFKPLSIEDAKLIFENREFIVSYFNGGISKQDFSSWTFEDEVRYTERETEEVKNGRKASFLIFNNDEYVGRCMLHRINIKDKSADVSISIKEKYWGQGYGNEAVIFLEKNAFSKLKLNRLEYGFYSNNERSKKLAEKNGFIYEGTMRDSKKIGSKYYDRLVYSKLKNEYKK